MLYVSMTTAISLEHLCNRALLQETARLAASERSATVQLISAIAEVDARRLYLGEGCSSLFVYCTRVLRLSEHAAYGRIEAARAARRFPRIGELLAEGALTLTAVTLLGRHLTSDNAGQVLEAARFKTKREVEEIVAAMRPRPDVVASVRKLPPPRPVLAPAHTRAANVGRNAVEERVLPTALAPAVSASAISAPPAARPLIAPIAPERYKVQLTVDRDTHDKLRRAQDLLRHAIPNGDPAEIFNRALTLLVEHLEKQKFAATTRTHKAAPTAAGSRCIAADVRRQVWKRDEGQCAFVGSAGRCSERGFLEFHHVVPHAAGGTADVENIQLRCRAHNLFEADLFFTCDAVRESRPAYGVELGPGPSSQGSDAGERL
jgi:hypothetical protein